VDSGDQEFRVAVIGGGFCGTMVAAHLLRGAEAPFSVALVERDPPLGRGRAYGTVDPDHRLNVPSGKMSADPDEPDHFLRWARANVGAQTSASSFLPRRVYADYLADTFREAAAAAKAGVAFHSFEDEAVSLSREKGGVRVVLKSGRSFRAARVVLALGNFPPLYPGSGDDPFGRSPRCVGNPWAPGALSAVAADDSVLMIGSGLTAADLIASLRRRGHRGKVHVVSRRGLLPLEHATAGVSPSIWDDESGPSTVRALLRRLRGEALEAAAQGRDWRGVVDGLRAATPRIWRRWTTAEKRRFLRHARPYWDVHRHRVPPETARALGELRDAGRLVVRAARVEGVRAGADDVEVLLRERGAAAATSIRVGWAFNCTGPSDPGRAPDPLMRDLLRRGLVRVDPLGLGLDADESGALLGRDGAASEFLSTLGPTLKGLWWESVAVPELRVQARDLARRLINP
jgi:uncharacterized NAD(P)/FAD-binding protein YdhS